MENSEGLLIFFDEAKHNQLLREYRLGEDRTFSDALSISDWRIKTKEVALLSFSDNSIDYISLAVKKNLVVTAKARIEFSHLVSLNAVNITEVENILQNNLRRHFIKSSQGMGSKVPQKTWSEVISIIKNLRPELQDDIERVLAIKEISHYKLQGHAADILLQEKEALGTALDIFEGGNELRKDVLGSWVPKQEDVKKKAESKMEGLLETVPKERASFLSGISTRYIQEESALQNDLFNWDGMTPVHNSGLSHFEKGDRVLNVIYANRNALEKTTGVDLIYFNQNYDSFVLVQYKLMKEEGDSMVYRPDDQLKEEIRRMDSFVNKYLNTSPLSNHEEFRLCDDGFFLKLIPNKGIQPTSSELSKGMYITRKYMHFLLSEKGPKGEQGGKIISFQNAPRYLTNTEFINFVNRAWVGTYGTQSSVLKSLVRQYYETGRALLIAQES
ncbi:MAG: hypothetical protein WA584_17625 [Pyrinomonadaceae bacterium]